MKEKFWRLKSMMSLLLCATLVLSGVPQVTFSAAAQEMEEDTVTRDVATEAEFIDALADSTVNIICLTDDITLSRSEDSKDNAFVIPRSVTITGERLTLERSGIVLGGAVTFENMEIYFASPVRNAIIANGYSLTLDNISNGGSSYNIDIFCGGVTDYNGGNLNEIPIAGTEGSVTIKGTNVFTGTSANIVGGNIYAGSLSDVGSGVEDIPNTYAGNAKITIEKGATGFGQIYAHGAREYREGGQPNAWIPSSDLYKVTGNVSVHLNSSTDLMVHGATGGENNAEFRYKDDGKGYLCSPILENISSIELEPSDEGTKANLMPVILGENGCSFRKLSVPANTRFSFKNMASVVSVSAFSGGGDLIFKEGEQTLEILEEISGTTRIAVGDISADGTSSTAVVTEGWEYISVLADSEDYVFELLPDTLKYNMVLNHDGTGSWITALEPSSVCINTIKILDCFTEAEDNYGVTIPIDVNYTLDENHVLSDIPMIVKVNQQECFLDSEYMGYATGTSESDLFMQFSFGDNDNEVLLITNYDYDVYSVPAGKYDISLTIPARYMANGQSYTLGFVLTVVCTEHTGGIATCKDLAVCEVCGESYGELNADNHADGIEIRNAKEATVTETGYTGDSYCLGCGVKVLDGVEIPISTYKLIITDGVVTSYEGMPINIEIPDGVTAIANNAFAECGTLKCITLPETLKSIGNYAFYDCSSLISIKLPSYLTSIGNSAFSCCSSLISIEIPSNVSNFGNGIFIDCNEELIIYCEPDSVAQTYAEQNNLNYNTPNNKVYGAVVFLDNNATYISQKSRLVHMGEVLGDLPIISKVGYRFEGWYTNQGEKVTKDTIITDDLVLYAQWKAMEDYELVIKDGELIAYHGTPIHVVVPNGVTSIASNAFYDCDSLLTIEIADTVNSISEKAFSNCTNLNSVSIPSSVTWIGELAFYNCSNLVEVGTIKSVKKIGRSTFANCSSLKRIELSEGLESISNNAFANCSSLESIIIPESVTEIGEQAFYRCAAISTIQLPSEMTMIEDYAFGGCKNLSEIELPSGITSITNGMFAGCEKLENIRTPSSVREIGEAAFANCIKLVNVEFAEGITRIDYYAFDNCDGLTCISLPSTIGYLGEAVFSNCDNLTSLEVAEREGYTFKGWYTSRTGGTSVTVDSIIKDGTMVYTQWTKVELPLKFTVTFDAKGGNNLSSSSLEVTEGLAIGTLPTVEREGYEFKGWYTEIGDEGRKITEDTVVTENMILYAAWEEEYALIIEDNVVTGYKGTPVDVVIPDGIIRIESEAFFNCSSLRSIKIPEGVTSIGDCVFDGCINLENIQIPGSIESLGGYVFTETKWLSNQLSENPLLIIGNILVAAAPTIKNAVIPDGVVRIGCNAFGNNTCLISVEIPDSVTTIERLAFGHCSNLTRVTIPNSVTSIGANAFYNCSSLESIDIPTELTAFGAGAFIGTAWYHSCLKESPFIIVNNILIDVEKTIENAVVPDGVVSIGESAFELSDHLSSVEIPSSVTKIEKFAFASSSLESIRIPESVTTIDSSAFWASENVTIYGKAGSYAQYYAQQENISFVADAVMCMVVFDANGGNNLSSSSLEVIEGQAIGTLPTVEREGYEFKGWYTEASGGTKVTVDMVVTVDMTLYAQWEEEELPENTCELIIEDGVVTGYIGTPIDVIIPEGVTRIEDSAFMDCSELCFVEIPESVTSIGSCAFSFCPKLVSVEIFAKDVEFDIWVFENCNLNLVVYGEADSSVENYVKENDIKFKSVEEKNHVVITFKENDDNGRYYGSNRIEIPYNQPVGKLPEARKWGCRFLGWFTKSVSGAQITEDTVLNKDTVVYAHYEEMEGYEIFIEDGIVTGYAGAPEEIVLPEGVIGFEKYALAGCQSLTSIELPDGITNIAEGTFLGCSNLQTIILPNSVTSVGKSAFQSCGALTDISFGENVTDIEEYAFCYCYGLKSVSLPEGLTVIKDSVFSNCESLESIVIPDTVTRIEEGAFYGCSQLTKVELPESVSYIGGAAFHWCGKLESINLPEGLTVIENDVFTGCAFKSIEIPQSVTRIGSSAFMDCMYLQNIKIPEKVTRIEEGAFAWCYNLKSAVILSNVIEMKNAINIFDSVNKDFILYCEGRSEAERYAIENNIKYELIGMAYYITSFDANGGINLEFDSKEIKGNQVIGTLPTVERNGYIFKGWFTSPNGATEVTASTIVTDDMILYAQWEKIIISITDATVSLSSTNYTYDGSAKKPAAKVTIGGKNLTKDTDYTVTYKNNTNAGTATVVITGKGNYTGSVEKTFTIKSGSIAKAEVKLSTSSYTYSGGAKKPTATVTLGGKTLTKDTDYTVTYKNNTNAGTATVVIKGKGNYTGTVEVAFTIKSKSMEKVKVKLSASSYTYNGKTKKPTVTVTLGDKTLKKDTDYTVSYKNNKNIGTATVVIKGKGNYTGTLNETFTIKVKTDTIFTSGDYKYKVTDSSTVAFAGLKNTKLKEVVVADKVTYGGKTYKVTAIASGALKNNTTVTSITIGKYVKSINTSAFEGCKKLSKVTFGTSVTEIGAKAFKDCTALKSIILPSKTETVGKQAFYGCKNLKTITIKSTKLKTVGKEAFKKINANASIKVPKSKLKDYTKLLKKAGIGSKVKIKKY